jgi:subtilase family serine protease
LSKHRLLAAIVGLLFAVTASPGSSAQTSSLSGPLPLDPSVKEERSQYAKLHIEEQYGVPFRPFASVCQSVPVGRMRCFAKVVTDEAGFPVATSGRQKVDGYGPAQLRAAYGITGIATGLPIIGIVDAFGYPNGFSQLQGDLTAYSKHFKIAALPKCEVPVAQSSVPCLEAANQKGGKRLPKVVDQGWAAEQAIDVQLAHAICENCSILLIEANTDGNGDLLPAENTAAKLGSTVISNSWGNSEFSVESGLDSYFDHPGVAITAGGGDDGYGILWPSASPNVVSVGGTSLFMKGVVYKKEVVWPGTGGGCTQFEARPSWQPSLPGCPDNRTTNDVSAIGDPNTGVAIRTGPNWQEFGGTSVGTPIVAAIYALAHNVPPNDDQAADLLYQNATSADLHDITKGSNGTCEFTYLCNAVTGYDAPTGLGTPLGLGDF